MNKLPYVQPEREVFYCLGILLLVISALAETKKGKKVLTIDKLQSFYFLASRPDFLNSVLVLAGKTSLAIDEVDYYTVETISLNIDELFDRQRILQMIKILSSKDYMDAGYSKTDGYFFNLTYEGHIAASKLEGSYFEKVRGFIERISAFQSYSPNKINGYIKSVLVRG
ncbi:ABC-three component system middle component 4 [Marinobacter oulmenensis]|uniref:Uncharacterized protein n=1 Tax=Marinobacter oulmenensis TaxID=643747 RepID=A0A840UHU1_9GAMM|nr:ABC-three component system middle component 4 [Marinobacter oulmenensis]MBB5321885.1 hypothetical protein [Marinobacter oulmenensis]